MIKTLFVMAIFMFDCCLLFSQINSTPDNANQAIDSTSNFLDQVVITGTRTQHTLKNTPVLTKVIPNMQLVEMGAVTVLDALENLIPGVTFNPDNNHGDNVQIQGLDNKYILVLLNGERMVNGKAENVNFSRLNVADIQRIEIIDGAASVLYGSNAIGAVINIITKDVSKPVDIRLGGRYSNFNTYVADASFGFKGTKWSSKTVFNTKGIDGYRVDGTSSTGATVSQRVYPSDDYSITQAFKYAFTNTVNAGLSGSFYQQQVWPYKDIYHRRELDYGAGAFVNWNIQPTNLLVFSVNTDRYNASTITNQTSEKTSSNNYYISSARITDTWTVNEYLKIVGGYEFNHEYSHAPDRFNADSATQKAYDNNLFLQGEINIAKSLKILLGGRLTQHSEFGTHLTPKISAMYQLGGFRFRAGVSNGFKAPSLKEMYYDFYMPGGFWIKGNTALKPESSWYESVSVEYIAPKINCSVTAYNNRIDDKIDMVQYNNLSAYTAPVIFYENVDGARIRGIDVSLQTTLARYFNLTASYAFADTEDETTGQPLYGTSKHTFTGGMVFRYQELKLGRQKWPMSLNFSGRAASPRLYNSVDEAGIITSKESKTTSVWRMVYTQDFPQLWKTINLELQAGIDNLFNWKDPQYTINPGRTYFIALKCNF